MGYRGNPRDNRPVAENIIKAQPSIEITAKMFWAVFQESRGRRSSETPSCERGIIKDYIREQEANQL